MRPAPDVITPAPRDVWADLVAADPGALACQTPEWLDAMRATGAYADASRLYTFAGGTRALLPLARRRRPLPGALAPLGSMPAAWGMGGLIADGPLDPADARAVVDDLSRLRAVRTTVRPNPLQDDLWTVARSRARVVRRRAHVLALDGGPDRVWRSYSGSARTAVRKAERAGLEVRCGTSDALLADYQRLYSRSVERWAAMQHEPLALARLRARARDAPAKLTCLAAALGEGRLRVWVAYRDGAAAAAIVVLLGRDASYTRGAMDKALAGPASANDLLHWLAIRDACAAGCGRYHMGETGTSRSLAQFKEKLGARPVDYHEYRFERLPLTPADAAARRLVKGIVGFRDAPA